MPTFITRVEMHGATGEDYNKLHTAMERAGFSRIVVSTQNVRYHLPTAEYIRSGSDLTCQKVLNEAVAAAGSVRRDPSVLVAETVGNWYWWNLRTV
jgi:hypothetical protein